MWQRVGGIWYEKTVNNIWYISKWILQAMVSCIALILGLGTECEILVLMWSLGPGKIGAQAKARLGDECHVILRPNYSSKPEALSRTMEGPRHISSSEFCLTRTREIREHPGL